MFEQALEFCDEVIALKPKISKSYSNKATVLSRVKKVPQALAHYDKALKLDPNNLNVLYLKGCLLEDQKEFKAALSCIDDALELGFRSDGIFRLRERLTKKIIL